MNKNNNLKRQVPTYEDVVKSEKDLFLSLEKMEDHMKKTNSNGMYKIDLNKYKQFVKNKRKSQTNE